MPSIEENLAQWDRGYAWPDGGEEWSRVWGGSGPQWEGSILPRIRAFLPARSILEIGCGHGRWSRRLRPWCERLVLVDLAPVCVEACRREFFGDLAVEVFPTNGKELPGAETDQVDFCFSFDSLVHADQEVLSAYLRALAVRLARGGVAFIHHSNFGAVLSEKPGSRNLHWRSEDVSAETFSLAAGAVGLVCSSQEIVDWGGVEASDCFSVVVRQGAVRDSPFTRLENPHFMGEAQSIGVRSRLYGASGAGPAGGSRGPATGSVGTERQ